MKSSSGSFRRAVVALRFQKYTHVKQLTMHHLNPDKLTYLNQIIDKMSPKPTHVVSKIMYGAQGIFEFSELAESEQAAQVITGRLTLTAKLIKGLGKLWRK